MNKAGQSNSIEATFKGVRLPGVPCRGVILSNWSVENNAAMNDKRGDDNDVIANPSGIGLEVYWGFGRFAHQLHLGETTPFIIPVNNANEITVGCRQGAKVMVWYSLIF